MTRIAALLMGFGLAEGLTAITLPLFADVQMNPRKVIVAVTFQFVSSLLWAIAYYRQNRKLYNLETEVLIGKMMPGKWVVK